MDERGLKGNMGMWEFYFCAENSTFYNGAGGEKQPGKVAPFPCGSGYRDSTHISIPTK